MTGQAINENSIDDFTQDELWIIRYALTRYKVLAKSQQTHNNLLGYQYDEYVQEVQQLRKKVVSMISK